MRPLAEYYEMLPGVRDALRCRVCGSCINCDVDGTSNVDSWHDCAPLFDRLPEVVETISRVHSAEIDEYATALQENICAQCFHQHLDGSCKLRTESRCALFHHLAPIIAIIERRA